MTILLPPIVLATFAAFAVAWVKRMPTKQFCPTCRHRAQTIVVPLWLRPASPWIALRWCADCDWQSIGRKGPEWVPDQQVAHDSGFHWGDDVVGENMGFRWRRQEMGPTHDTPPDHPSGFRFAETEMPPTRADHHSGFNWGKPAGPTPADRRREESDRRRSSHPSGFLWGNRRTDRAGGSPKRREGRGGFFRWKKKGSDDRRRGKGFDWGGVA